MTQPNRRAFIIGAGMVGATTAYALLMKEAVNEIFLIDINEKLAKAQVLDLQHGSAFESKVKVKLGKYEDIRQNDIVIITAGAAQKPGQTRLELAKINVKIVDSIIDEILKIASPVYMILVTNPVDVITYYAIKKTNFPKGMVFGSGTSLDTARLRGNVGAKLGINPTNVHAYQLGEHGDSSFCAMSTASFVGNSLAKKNEELGHATNDIEEQVRRSAYEIIEGKGSTYYAIASTLAHIIDCMLNDTGKALPLSILLDGQYGLSDVCLSLPVQIGHAGATNILEPTLDNQELEKLKQSAEIIKEAINSVN